MRAKWQALHAQLVKSSSTLAFQKEFESICGRREVLRSFRDPAELFDRLHSPSDDHPERNMILRALVEETQRQGRSPQTCVTLILLALWPGLDHVRFRLSRYFRREPDQLASEISARTTQGILTLDLGQVSWIAATLTRNTERDIRRDLKATWARDTMTDEFAEGDDAQSPELPSRLGLPPGLDANTATRMITELLRDLIGDDAELVVAVAINGEHQHEAAMRPSLTPEAARKRYQRAINRLRNVPNK